MAVRKGGLNKGKGLETLIPRRCPAVQQIMRQ